jgi:hypothetical protein
VIAAVLHGLDGVVLDGRPLRRRPLCPDRIVEAAGLPCTDVRQTLVDLATVVGDDVWEQALESALRRHVVTVDALVADLPSLSGARTPGTARIRRVLDRRRQAHQRRRVCSRR